MIRDDATQRQVNAADPHSSTWLAANAGSGKTRVLTDRVARLLLSEVQPQNILCLTYTKAAAAEMQNRLFETLGAWAMMADDHLRDKLAALGEERRINSAELRQARQLFASAIETPGGLKIQTIHSFCAGVLRRFPLEAHVSPQFKEMDDRTGALLRDEVLDHLVSGPNAHVIETVLRHYTGSALADLAQDVAQKSAQFETPCGDEDLRKSLGLAAHVSPEMLLGHVFDAGVDDALIKLRDVLKAGSSTEVKAADKLQKIDFTSPRSLGDLKVLEGVFLTGASAKAPFSAKIGSFPTKATREAHPALIDEINMVMEAVAATRQDRLGLLALERSRALHDFAALFLPAYAAGKQARGLLDFDDLILKTRALLTDRSLAQWVLFRLDGGIDHVLVDEAQDTSPAQWDVIQLLTQEFTAGQGARDNQDRTIFVVGDQKQSIYSFQGAAPEAFDQMRQHFATGLQQAGQGLQSRELLHSFRSSAAILRAVDRTFADGIDMGTPDTPTHIAFKEDMPGRVDLWPLIPKSEAEDDRIWYAPIDQPSAQDEIVVLAHQIAAQIKHMIAHETLPVEIGRSGTYNHRKITAGDFLILVRGRVSGLFAEIISACKQAGLDIAGADRLRVGAELAVRDIRALLAFLALPEDDLSLACALRSPLFGWSEQDIFSLAHGRADKTYLWSALRKDPAHVATTDILRDLRKQADFLRPYDLIERILTRFGGRKNLLARLGEEAKDGIDALLSQALTYEGTGTPSLTGFLAWMDADDLVIKRQMDSQGDKIRVMTVHGAKGLEAPIVIMPDTLKAGAAVRDTLFTDDDTVIWPPSKDTMSDPVLAMRDAIAQAAEKEANRLLYVAMTRAEKWLIVAGAGDLKDDADNWYTKVATAMTHLGAGAAQTGPLSVQRYAHGDWTSGAPIPPNSVTVADVAAPVFGALPPVEKMTTLAPSQMEGAKTLSGHYLIEDEETAMARGTAVHLLLEHLPQIPEPDRPEAAASILASLDADIGDHKQLATGVIRLLAMPALAHIWAEDVLREVDFTADIGKARFHGTIDALIVADGHVHAIDYKSNRIAPDQPADIPEGVLRQMAIYEAALKQIFPDHAITLSILWTQTADLMAIPEQVLQGALARVTSG